MPFDGRGYVGPAFLAQQPTTAPAPKPVDSWPLTYAHVEARLNALRAWRYTWWWVRARVAEFILPYRYKWLVTANTYTRNGPVNDDTVDETALLAMRVCAHGTQTGLMDASSEWFKLGARNDDDVLDAPARDWIEIIERRVYDVLAGSNFYTTMGQGFQDVVTFGTAPLIIEEDFEDVIRCYLPCAGEYYLGLGGRLAHDTLYREFTLTVEQLVGRFGLDCCPRDVQELWNRGGNSLENEFVVAHAIEPNFPLSGKGRNRAKDIYPGPAAFPWRSIYWLKGKQGDAPLEALGETEQPFGVAAWERTSNDPYSYCPGTDAVGATRQLQHEQVRKGEFIDKGVRPPMGGDPELENKPSSILPGQLTFVNTANGKKGFWPLFEVDPAHLAPMIEDIKEIQARIERCFYNDVFLMISQMEGVQPRNQLEILERKGEKIQQLGPMVQIFTTEFAPTVLRRVLGIMQRRRLFPPVPPSMRGKPLTIKFTGMLALLQRASETASIERGTQFLGQLDPLAVNSGAKPPTRIVNWDKAARDYLDRIAFPSSVLFTSEQVAQMDQAADRQKQTAQTAAGAQAAIGAAQGLSNVQVGGGRNAIEALLGQEMAPQPQAQA